MMKRQFFVLTLCIVAVTTSVAKANVTLFTEDFENALTGWTVQDNNTDGYTWSVVNNDFYGQFDNGAYADLDADRLYYEEWVETDWNDALVSPVINVANMASVNVSADIFMQPYYDGCMTVSCSTDNGQTWQQLQIFDSSQNGNVNWNIDLTAGTTDMLLSFGYYSSDVDYQILQMDNVLVEGTPVPEPTTLSLLTIGLAGIIRSRNKA